MWDVQKYRAGILGLAILAAVIAGGCTKRSPAVGISSEPTATVAASRDFKDDLDRTVLLPAKVEKAVSLAPSLTEMIFAAGAGDKLVGVTTYCDYPAAARSIAKVGDTQTPNIEKIIALQPDVVFVSRSSQLEAFKATLEQRNIAVYVTDSADLHGIEQNLRRLGEIFGTETVANAAAADIEKRAAAVEERVKGLGRPTVFVQISNEPLFTIGADSFLTAVVESAGGVSVSREVPTAYPKLSKETAIAMAPDVIILSESDDNREPNAVFKNTAAVKNGRVYRINADILSRPGPRLIVAMEKIADILHPKE